MQFRLSLTVIGLSSSNKVYKASFNDFKVTEAEIIEDIKISKYFKRNHKVE